MIEANRNPTFRQLQVFAALVETLSVSKVAEKLHISQPSVSVQLRKLTELMQAQLYTVQNKKVQITEAGLAVYRASLSIERTIRLMKSEITELNGLKAGTLKLSVVTTAQYFTSKVIGAFCRDFPKIDIQLTVCNRKTVLERFKQQLDDFYILGHWPEHISAEKTPLINNELVVISDKKHELTLHPKVSLNRLQHYPFIMRELGSGTRMTVDSFCREQHLSLKQKMSVESDGAIKQLVSEGLGLAIVSRHSLYHDKNQGVAELNVEQFPIINRWNLIRCAGVRISPVANKFEDFVKSYIHKSDAN